MYCGDETGSFVGDVGSHSCRFGYGGDDSPSAVFPSFMYSDGSIPLTCHKLPSVAINTASSHSMMPDLIPIYQPLPLLTSSHCNPEEYRMRDGVIHSLDAWENAWIHALDQLHGWDTNKHTSGSGSGLGGGVSARKTSSSFSSRRTRLARGGDDASSSSRITHPLLAIDAGLTLYDNSNPSNNNNNNDSFMGGKGYQDAISRKQRTGMLEILFESLQAPAAFIAPTPMVASFAHGRQTSLLVDVGAAGMRVTPIVDGFILHSAQKRTGRGGEWLAHVQYCALEQYFGMREKKKEQNVHQGFLHPRYAVHTSSTTTKSIQYPSGAPNPSSLFHQSAQRQVLYEMRTSTHVLPLTLYRGDDWTIPFVSYSSSYNSPPTPVDTDTDHQSTHGGSTHDKNPKREDDVMSTSSSSYKSERKQGPCYELPDGTSISFQESSLGYDFRRLPELFFATGTLPFQAAPSSSSNTNNNIEISTSLLSIQELIQASLSAVPDADIRKELTSNIILTGASSLYGNMEQRLSLELSVLLPNVFKTKVIASRDSVERRFAPWIGASILSSLGSFQQLWLGQREYDEYGALLSLQRFP